MILPLSWFVAFSPGNMNASRIAAGLRAFGSTLVSGALVWMVLFSAFASASPSLHHWLHSDHQAPSHYCLVTTIEQGHSDVTSVGTVVLLPTAAVPVAALPCESFFVSHDLKLFPERGPPVLS